MFFGDMGYTPFSEATWYTREKTQDIFRILMKKNILVGGDWNIDLVWGNDG